MAFDFKKEYKEFYMPKGTPSIVTVPKMNFIAVRGSGDGRYVYVGEQQSSAFAGTQIIVRKTDVTVLAESASTVSVAEDLSYSKVLYMEDRVINEGGAVMLYEE